MKMRLTGFLAVALLSISILSYGISGPAFADEHNIPPVSVSTDLTVYGKTGRQVYPSRCDSQLTAPRQLKLVSRIISKDQAGIVIH